MPLEILGSGQGSGLHSVHWGQRLRNHLPKLTLQIQRESHRHLYGRDSHQPQTWHPAGWGNGESHIGEVSEWEMAETALKNALVHMNLDYKINEGDGAFYGPKIDIHVTDCIGREWQCGTIQLDMQLPKRFNLTYVDSDGSLKEPIMIHRVVYGSLERMIAVLIENFAGAFPTWLSPVQVKILNISDAQLEYAKNVKAILEDNGIRVELDDRNEKIGKKIREAQLEKVPYMLVVGDKEMAENKVAVRHRKEGDKGVLTINQFVENILAEIKSKEIK